MRAAAGTPDREFWQRIYKPRHAYGADIITGWIARLFPYLESRGRIAAPNPLLEVGLDERADDGNEREGYWGPGVKSHQVPSLPSTARITVVDQMGGRDEVALDGGILAVAQDQSGRLAPICGWVLRRSEAHIAGTGRTTR